MKILRKTLWQHINPDTNYYCKAKITLSSGEVLTLTSDEDFLASGNSYTHTADSGFPIGQSLCKTVKLTIDNFDKRYSDYNFTGAKIDLYTEINVGEVTYDEYGNDITERATIKEGIFYITDIVDTRGDSIEITGYDAMIRFDTPVPKFFYTYCDNRTLTIDKAFSIMCNDVGLKPRDIETTTYSLLTTGSIGNEPITFLPNELTYRQLLSYIAGMVCGNAIFTPQGKLAVKRWNFYDETAVITGNNATDEIHGNEATDIISSRFGRTFTENNVTYFEPETTTLNNALDEVATNIDDIMITALKVKYHQTIQGGTQEASTIVPLSSVIDYQGLRSEAYNYVARITGYDSSDNEIVIEKDLTCSYTIIDFGSSPPNPTAGDNPWYDEEKEISGVNHLYYFSLTDAQAESFVGAIKIEISSLYNGRRIYVTTIEVSSYSQLINNIIYNYRGVEIPITIQNPPPTGSYYITNGQDIKNNVFNNIGYGIAYQPNSYAIEEYYTLDLEFLTDETRLMADVAERILGVEFRPFSGKFVPNPTVEIMDSVYLEYKNEVYFSFITNLTFNYLGDSEFQNTAESKEQKELAYGTTTNNVQWEQIQRLDRKTSTSNKRLDRKTSTSNTRSRSAGQTVLLPTAITDGKITDYITCTLRDGEIW